MSFDFTTKQWLRGPNNNQAGYGVNAVDEKGHIWFLARDQAPIEEFDPVADVWITHKATSIGFYYSGAVVFPSTHQLVLTHDGATITVYDLTSPDQDPVQPSTKGLDGPLSAEGAPGFEYLPSLDRGVLWTGGRTIRLLDPATWTWSVVEATGDDPGAPTATGTYGRFRYSPKRGVFVVVNSASKNVFLFKPPLSAP